MATNNYCLKDNQDVVVACNTVVMAVVALLCLLFSYQNVAVLYLIVNISTFLHQRHFGTNQKIMVILVTSRKCTCHKQTREGVFCTLLNDLVAPEPIWILAHKADNGSVNNEPQFK